MKTLTLMELGKATKICSQILPTLSTKTKGKILVDMAELIQSQEEVIQSENQLDLKAGKEKGLSAAMIDRLTLTSERIQNMADSLKEVAELPDPVGEIIEEYSRPNGLIVQRRRIPLGVIGVIYESRPNVTVESASLCFYAGNGLFLRGGSEAIHSNRILVKILKEALTPYKLENAINIVPTTERSTVDEMAKMDDVLDVIIPRGGEGLIRRVKSVATVPVIAHYKGNCHIYVDESANIDKARKIVINGKTQRPGVCNATETLLVHKNIADSFMPPMLDDLKNNGVEIRGCDKTRSYSDGVKPATSDDYEEEFLDLILAVKVVDNVDVAINHIHQYGSDHTEAIVSENPDTIEKFVKSLDSSAIMINTSTRFNDGGELGLGAEIGISTTKMHAFGPMGLRELTTSKFVVRGEGQLRA
jgi:glutamate-5-semialdehyde dehydrogenase